MITRDFIMRQVQQMVQALALVLFHRRERDDETALTILEGTLTGITGMSLERIRTLDREDLVAICSPGGTLSTELAVGMADLLREDDDPRSLVRSRWLYETVIRAGGAVPLDIHDRISGLPGEI